MADHPAIQLSRSVYITDLEFADDVVVFDASPAAMLVMFDRITHYAAKVGLEINTKKWKSSQPFQSRVPNNFSPAASE